MGREWREQGRSASASSVRGPSDWSGVIRMHCEALNIRWTSRKRNGYYSKQKFSSMRVCEEVKKFDEFAAWDCNQEKKKCKKPLAPGKTCDRLAPICIPHFLFLESWGVAFVGKAEEFTLEVSRNGPRSTDRDLADHLRQHLFFRSEDVVVASRGFCRGRQHRSSFHRHVYIDGFCFCRRAGFARLSRLEISRRRFFQEGFIFPRQHDPGNCLDGAHYGSLCGNEPGEQLDLGFGAFPARR